MFKAYKNLSPKARAGVGIGIIAWGAAGLYFTDKAEESLGYTPTEKDKEELERWKPRIITVDKTESR